MDNVDTGSQLPEQHPALSPALRAAKDYLESLGRPPAPPLPRDIHHLATYLIHGRDIWRQLEALDAGADLPPFFIYGPLFLALLATRPWGDVDPSDHGVDEEDREDYLIPLAMAVARRWKLHGRIKRHQLKTLAEQRECSPDEVKVEIVARAVLLVQNRRDDEHAVKLGEKWVKDTSGKMRHDVRPGHDLYWPEYLRWWQAQVYATARGMLLDEMSEAETDRPTEGPIVGRESEPVGILAALETEHARDGMAALAEVQDASTPRQRELLEVLYQSLCQQAPDETLANAKARAAEVLEVDPKAIDMALSRIRKRISS